MPAMQLTCPQCQLGLEMAQPPPAGTRLQCSRCGNIFVVPDFNPSAPPLLFTPVPAPEAPEPPLMSEPDQARNPISSRSRLAADRGPNKVLLFGILGGALVLVLVVGVTLALMSGSKGTSIDTAPVAASPAPAKPKTADPGKTAATKPALAAKTLTLAREEDLEVAKRRAQAQKKDLLIWFDGSDWSQLSQQLERDVFRDPESIEAISRQFIVVWLDFPQEKAAQAKVRDPQQNDELSQTYAVAGFPTVVLADAEGRPYGYLGYGANGAAAFREQLDDRRKLRTQLDRLLADVGSARGEAQLDAAIKALEFLRQLGPLHDRSAALRLYDTLLAEWYQLAVQYDPDDAKGHLEKLFTLHWQARARKISDDNPKERQEALEQLAAFKKKHMFKDANTAALLHLLAAGILVEAGQLQEARDWVEGGLASQPSEERLRTALTQLKTQLGFGGRLRGSGTAFVVFRATDGDQYLLTNEHVVRGAKSVHVRPAGSQMDPIEVTVVAKDPKEDIAVLRLKADDLAKLEPLPVVWEREVATGTRRPLRAGDGVAAFGFPLGEALGSNVKLTTGNVAEDPPAGGKVTTTCLTNPGNSGGPLCDSYGNVVGMNTAVGGGFGGKYGFAIPGDTLANFLQKHVPDYRSPPARTEKKDWADINVQVKDSVLMVFNVR